MTAAVSADLTTSERDVLADCEATISRGLRTFVKVGQALVTIRDNRLYRQTHSSFEEYCEQRWYISSRRAYQFLDAAEVHELISRTNVQEINSGAPARRPVSEAQVRPLTRLLPPRDAEPAEQEQAAEEIRETWVEAVATAPKGPDGTPKVTARHVEDTVLRRQEREAVTEESDLVEPASESPTREPRRRPITDAARDAGQELRKAIERLERLAADDRFRRNKSEVAAHLRHHLAHALEVCQDLSDQLN